MILVFGGTTEGKQVIQLLNSLQLSFVYTTKTEIKAEVGTYGTYIHGVLTVQKLQELIIDYNIKSIVHASHPFAEVLHATIAEVSDLMNIPVYRIDRQYPERIVSNQVQYVANYKALKTQLQTQFKQQKGLFLTGVQTIEKLSYFWKQQTSYFRILDREISIHMALKNHFPKSQLILGMPTKEVAKEVALIKKLGIDFVVTKESGESGALSVKIAAAQQCNVPILILQKPKLPNGFKVMKDINVLKETIQNNPIKFIENL